MTKQKIFLHICLILLTSISSSLQTILPGGCVIDDLSFVEVTDFHTEKDFEQAKQLLQENWNELIGNDKSCTIETLNGYSEYLFKNQKSANYPGYPLILKVIKNTGGIIGFIGYVLYDSANNDRDYAGPYMMNPPLDRGHIEILAIDSGYRKKGLAKKLLEYAIQDLTQKGAKKINVGVNHENKSALGLYHKIGFVKNRTFDDQSTILIKIV